MAYKSRQAKLEHDRKYSIAYFASHRSQCLNQRKKWLRRKLKTDPAFVKRWRASNLIRVMRWKQRHLVQCHEMELKRARRIRAEVIAGYGGICSWSGCGETEHLEIAHINRNGKKHRRGGSGTLQSYRDLIRLGFPTTGQWACRLLCRGHHLLYDGKKLVGRRRGNGS